MMNDFEAAVYYDISVNSPVDGVCYLVLNTQTCCGESFQVEKNKASSLGAFNTQASLPPITSELLDAIRADIANVNMNMEDYYLSNLSDSLAEKTAVQVNGADYTCRQINTMFLPFGEVLKTAAKDLQGFIEQNNGDILQMRVILLGAYVGLYWIEYAVRQAITEVPTLPDSRIRNSQYTIPVGQIPEEGRKYFQSVDTVGHHISLIYFDLETLSEKKQELVKADRQKSEGNLTDFSDPLYVRHNEDVRLSYDDGIKKFRIPFHQSTGGFELVEIALVIKQEKLFLAMRPAANPLEIQYLPIE